MAQTGTGDEVLLFIHNFSQRMGYAPTVREIMLAVGLSSSSVVHYHLRQLKGRGVIDWVPGRARTLRVVP